MRQKSLENGSKGYRRACVAILISGAGAPVFLCFLVGFGGFWRCRLSIVRPSLEPMVQKPRENDRNHRNTTETRQKHVKNPEKTTETTETTDLLREVLKKVYLS